MIYDSTKSAREMLDFYCRASITLLGSITNGYTYTDNQIEMRLVVQLLLGQFSSDGRDILGLFLPLQGLSRAYK